MDEKPLNSAEEPQGDTVVDISCEEVFRALGGYLENDIDATLRLRMQEHFKKCGHCRALLDGSNNVIQLIGDGQAFPVPAGFSSRLYRKLEDQLASKKK